MARSVQRMSSDGSRARHKRIMIWSFVIMLAGSVMLPLSGYLYVALVPQAAQAAAKQDSNPRANFWRYVREGNQGYTSASGPYTTNVLIQNGGENWRNLRNGPVSNIAPWWLAIVLLAIGGFYLLFGQGKLEHRPSGKTVERWNLNERVLHWYTATLFLILAITGLSLLFGRAALIPVFGLKGYSVVADFTTSLHNYLGPFLIVGVLLEVIAWMKYNVPRQIDWDWIKKWGGLVGKHPHIHAGRMNGGEKVWFWIIATIGVAVCITGLIMDFPNFGQSRETMQLSNLIHSALAVIWLSVAFSHIYIGTIGTEGALEGMTTGRVSVEWAKQHHDLWYEEVRAKGGVEEAEQSSKVGKGAPSPRGSSG
jgi:formate dehydrogenase subunit gamma